MFQTRDSHTEAEMQAGVVVDVNRPFNPTTVVLNGVEGAVEKER